MNSGAFGENFPYSNFHDLNMDWIIKIAKDFLDQYTHIQQIIADGETALENLTNEGLQQLQDKADNLEALLQEWYNNHSSDIANQLADALTDITNALASSILSFNTSAENKTTQLLATIPDDYTVMYNNMIAILRELPTKLTADIRGYETPDDVTLITGSVFWGAVGETLHTFNIENSSSIKYPVSQLQTIEIAGYSWAIPQYGLYFFLDADNKILSKYPTEGDPIRTNGTVINVPADAVYVCVNGDTNNPASVKTPVYNSFDESTAQFMKTYKFSYVDSEIQPTDGTIYRGTVGSAIQRFTYADGSYIKVDVSEYDSVSVSGTTFQLSMNFRLCFFTDVDDIIVGTVEVEQGAHSDVIAAVPINAKYAYVNGNATQYARALPQLKYGEYNTNFEQRTYEEIDEFNPVKGKTMLLLGDSITKLGTSNRGWVKYFNAIANAEQIDNIAVDGARWTDYNNSTIYDGTPQNYNAQSNPQNVIGNQVQRIINNPGDFLSSYDFIMILAGVNDPVVTTPPTPDDFNAQYYNGNAVLPVDSADRSTWAGATRYSIEKLHTLFPNAQIIVSTILNPVAGYNTAIPINTGETLRKCAKVCSVKVCDIEECGIRPDDTTMYVDTLHPSEKGAKVMGEYIAKWYRNNI